MLVRERMTTPAVTITPETPFQEALKLMRRQEVQTAARGGQRGQDRRDRLRARHAPHVALAGHLAERLGSELPVVEAEDQRHHDAQRADHQSGHADRRCGEPDGDAQDRAGVPVVDNSGKVVGVITETDIFKAFVEMLGGGEHGLRLTVQVPTGSGTLAKLAGKITELGGLILSVGSMNSETDGPRNRRQGQGRHRGYIATDHHVGVDRRSCGQHTRSISDKAREETHHAKRTSND